MRSQYRKLRTQLRKLRGIEPMVNRKRVIPLEFHGNEYCGWSIPRDWLSSTSVVVDVGLGEDISFSRSVAEKYRCKIHGFDPTPRSIEFMKRQSLDYFTVNSVGLGTKSGLSEFYVPKDEAYVSGSIHQEDQTRFERIEVELITLGQLFENVHSNHIDLLKLDVEGAEYDILMSEEFLSYAESISILALEFHHRFASRGKAATQNAVRVLTRVGFQCCWANTETNEEFTFIKQ